jgi:hypothetical protein
VKASGGGMGTVRVVHLDGDSGNRVPVRLSPDSAASISATSTK